MPRERRSYLSELPSVSVRHARRHKQPLSLRRRAQHPVPAYNEAIKHVQIYDEDGRALYAVDLNLRPTQWTSTSRVVVVLPRGRAECGAMADRLSARQFFRPETGELMVAQQVRQLWVDPRRRTGLYELRGLRVVAEKPLDTSHYLSWIHPNRATRRTNRIDRGNEQASQVNTLESGDEDAGKDDEDMQEEDTGTA